MAGGAHPTDTNILLRVSHRNDPDYGLIRSALDSLRAAGATLFYTPQNLAEFWNVCTRPARQNGRLLTLDQRDFARYPGIMVVHPREVARSY
jgi:hypothetical protein